MLWLKGQNLFNSDNIIFGVVYVPPIESAYSEVDCFNELENEITRVSKITPHICLLGDFNAHTNKLADFVHIDKGLIDIFESDEDTKYHLNCHKILENLGMCLDRHSTDIYGQQQSRTG